jgi:DNA-binding FadR family transcriptional regulator
MVSRAASLAEEIEGAIASGEIPLGSRLGTKDELRRRYFVAYGTLNEALRILQQRGYVTSRTGPGGGLFASAPSGSLRLSHLTLGFREGGTMADCAAVRHALEPVVAVDAARSRTRADVEALEAIVERMRASAADPAEYLRQNWLLHRRIAETSRNRILGNLYCTLLDASEAELTEVVADRQFAEDVKRNLAVHREIVAAIADGSAARARRAAERHEGFFSAMPGGSRAALRRQRG